MTESYKLKYLAYLNSLTPGRRNEETLQALQAKNKKAKKQNGNNADKPVTISYIQAAIIY